MIFPPTDADPCMTAVTRFFHRWHTPAKRERMHAASYSPTNEHSSVQSFWPRPALPAACCCSLSAPFAYRYTPSEPVS